jgi:peptide methionine sulfoxide reductase msrA/msrB
MLLKTKSLPNAVLSVMRDKGTEHPFSSDFENADKAGTYLCRQCGLALFRSQTKFFSGCGWPSFDEEILGNIIQQRDEDNIRTEIICKRCHGHLGHIFQGEGFTPKNIRHCVNGLSLEFVDDLNIQDTEEAIFAAGCFWGVEYYFKKLSGVIKTEVGYTGGHKENPTYNEVCNGNTGHFEAIRVLYDPQKINYEKLVKYFFEIHDPTQANGQGPDLGHQYQSAIFYYDEYQQNIAEIVKEILEKIGYSVFTKILPVATFWPAENYHQEYYEKAKKQPYCHAYTKRFDI